MHTVADLLKSKPAGLVSVEAGVSVRSAAALMNEKRIGAVVVTDGGAVRGILTERDILTRIVAPSRDPDRTAVLDVMTPDPLTCRPETRLSEARQVMRDKRIRHLPVVEQGRAVGMISIGDLNLAEHDALEATILSMQAYIAGDTM
ncbi:MAG: CBS domain-containing protein [Phycisphaerales bacterium JB039]